MRIEHDQQMRIYDRNGMQVHSATSWECTAQHLAMALDIIEQLRHTGNALANSVDAGDDEHRNVLLHRWDRACELPINRPLPEVDHA